MPETSVGLSQAASLLHDQYKDSFAFVRDREKLRDRLFLYVLLLLAALVTEVQYPEALPRALTEVQAGDVKVDLASLPVRGLLSFTWVMLFAFCLRHIQVSVTIERQYSYLHKLEARLDEITREKGSFGREGKAYLANFPAFTAWAWFFYTVIYPVAVVLVCAWSLMVEWELPSTLNTAFDTGMAIGVVVSVVLYRADQARQAKRKRVKR